MQRHSRWALVGTAYLIGAWVIVAVLASEPLGPPAVVTAVGAGCAGVGAGRLLRRQLPAATPLESEGVPVGPGLLAAAGGAAVTVAAQWFAGDPPWAIVPGVALGGLAASVPARRRFAVVGGGALVAAGLAAVAGFLATGSVAPLALAGHAAVVAVLGAFMLYSLWSLGVVDRLDRARALEAELAVVEERLRFAADLHDIQGHHLQVIALKSELAARLAEVDPAAARKHMREVHEQARTAITDTREVVRGYRRASLEAELANAARVLAAAGIDGRLDPNVADVAGTIPETGRNLLGLVVREATTNVLRHSRAGTARITLTTDDAWARLLVRNDGVAPVAAEPGTGLSALAQRLDAEGGALDWAREGEWFGLTARVPAGDGPA